MRGTLTILIDPTKLKPPILVGHGDSSPSCDESEVDENLQLLSEFERSPCSQELDFLDKDVHVVSRKDTPQSLIEITTHDFFVYRGIRPSGSWREKYNDAVVGCSVVLSFSLPPGHERSIGQFKSYSFEQAHLTLTYDAEFKSYKLVSSNFVSIDKLSELLFNFLWRAEGEYISNLWSCG